MGSDRLPSAKKRLHLNDEPREGQVPGVAGGITEGLFDAQQLVVLRDAFSLRAGAPVLIWPLPTATARSAMVVSSVSPERWLIMVRYPLLCANVTASRVSVRVPIWFTLTSSALAAPRSIPFETLGVGDEEVVADDLHPLADGGGRSTQPSQSSSLSGSGSRRAGRRRAGCRRTRPTERRCGPLPRRRNPFPRCRTRWRRRPEPAPPRCRA